MRIPRCHFDRPCHRWERSRAFGCQENPGVQDTGNGALLTVDVCAVCAMERARIRSYCGRTRDNRTTYRDASGSVVACTLRGEP